MDAAIPSPGCALNEDAVADRSPDPAPWFKRRGYPHFDRPLDLEQAQRLVMDPGAVAERGFLPFLAFDIEQRRYKKCADGTRRMDVKRRPVAFASHSDAAIFSYYAYLLKLPYEEELRNRGLTENVIAYRRFVPPKCNIHFAHEAIAEIERRGDCEAIALDIEKFFDTIPHDALKRLWGHVLGTDTLPPDHYAVFKAITKWAKADRSEVFKTLGIGRRQAENWRQPATLCTPREFREKIRGGELISVGYMIKGGRPVGIPQGSPISAMLSNLVMLEADSAVAEEAKERGVYYRRYSDDILLVGNPDDVTCVEKTFKAAMATLGLDINDDKTKRARFTPDGDGLLNASEPLQYLGFVFTGKRVLVRPQTIAKFIQRMKRSVRSASRAATAAGRQGRSGKIRRQELYARYSHLGPTQAMLKRQDSPTLRNNFYTYAVRAAREMQRSEIKRQLRKHWPRLNAEIELAGG
ncbi:MAG: group II intron reverse transcriptase domain-containing protein [Phycisphaeraceae bacterium]|nr:group II intron reverse transcriptase domain-containing protein [Phycisphaeraceae bacterium]